MSIESGSAGPSPEELRGTPVEVETGREAVAATVETISEFRTFASELPLGDQTRAAFNQILDSLATRPDAIQVFTENPGHTVGRFVHEAIFHGFDPSADATITPDRFLVEIRPAGIDQLSQELVELGPEVGLVIDQPTAQRLAYAHAVGHELAHGIEAAYSYVLPPREENLMPDIFPTPHYRTLAQDILDAGVSDSVNIPVDRTWPTIIESERVAEGVGQLFVVHEMQQLGLFSNAPEQDAAVFAALRRQRQNERYHKAVEILTSFAPEGGRAGVLKELQLAGATIGHIGYGTAHSREEINHVLATTP